MLLQECTNVIFDKDCVWKICKWGLKKLKLNHMNQTATTTIINTIKSFHNTNSRQSPPATATYHGRINFFNFIDG
jgi:hypothetical protein